MLIIQKHLGLVYELLLSDVFLFFLFLFVCLFFLKSDHFCQCTYLLTLIFISS